MNNFSNHDPKIISIYEILSSYFTDVLFNHIYLTIKGSKNTIDEYVKNVKNYISGLKTNIEYYNKMVKELHQYFLKHVGKKFSDLAYANFVARVVSVSTPSDHYSQLSHSDKEDIFSNILSELAANMAAFVTTSDMLQQIITYHTKNAKVTIRAIQDNAVSFLVEKRSILHNKFVKTVGEVKETTSIAYTEELKKSLKKANKEKNDALADLEDALDEIENLKDRVHKYKKELEASKVTEAKLRKLIELLNVRSEKGIVSAANMIKQPPHDTLAECKEILPYENDIPEREHIAEPVSLPSANPNALSNFFTKPIEIPKVTTRPPSQQQPPQQLSSIDISKSYLDLF
jgi:hypothetical protein